VFKGVIFDVYQWEQPLFDGSLRTFEKVMRNDSAAVLPVMPDGSIVISEQEQPARQPFIDILGGVVDDGESPESAARRELSEEGGMQTAELVLWDAQQPNPKVEYTIYLFIARGCKKVRVPILDAGEKITLRYVSFEDFIEIVQKPEFRNSQIKLKLLETQFKPERLNNLKRFILG